MFWEQLKLNKKEEWFPISRIGGCIIYIAERREYLLFGGENNTIAHHINRVQSKMKGNKDLSNNSLSSSGKEFALPEVATGKNDKLYFYNIGCIRVNSYRN